MFPDLQIGWVLACSADYAASRCKCDPDPRSEHPGPYSFPGSLVGSKCAGGARRRELHGGTPVRREVLPEGRLAASCRMLGLMEVCLPEYSVREEGQTTVKRGHVVAT